MKTPLYPYHAAHGKITEFAGYQMPLYYTSAVQEVNAVRHQAGLFDVSHMGVIEVTGDQAEAFVDFVSTNHIASKTDGSAIYTTLASKEGGCIDDVMTMRLKKTRFLIVANATNKEKVLNHFKQESSHFQDIVLTSLFQEAGFLALQGKEAERVLSIIPGVKNLQKHTLSSFVHPRFGELVISRTGYTGEDGFEILVSHRSMNDLWQEILSQHHVVPCGLAARDILRLEMGYALYGHELTDTISPIESVSHWTVKLDKERFIGKEALQQISQRPHRVEQGVVLTGKGVMRQGFAVLKSGAIIGRLTSGGYSPTLNQSIGIALLDEKQPLLQEIFIDIRGRLEPAYIEKIPFKSHHGINRH